MKRQIDNFEVAVNQLLQFDSHGDFYMAMVLKRRKDVDGQVVEGVNEDNRLIKHYFIYDAEYLLKKKQAIINLCEQNNARAYILPQRRDCRLVLWALHNKVSDILKDGSMNVHFDHLIRACVAGIHETAEKWHKRWVIDLDEDDPIVQYHIAAGKKSNGFTDVSSYATWLRDKLSDALVTKDGYRKADAAEFMPNLSHYYNAEDITLVNTPHGWHVVTPPFNRDSKALEQYFGPFVPRHEMIKPDAMTLIYSPKAI